MTELHVLSGPETSQVFQLDDDAIYIGRARVSNIRVEDKTVSRRHVKIVRRGDKYFITDLKSRNGTSINGNYIAPGLEVEVKESEPITIGMTVLCLGKECKEELSSFLDSAELKKESYEQSGIFEQHGHKTNQKKLELFYKVSEVLRKKPPVKEALEEILNHILGLLGRVDRGAFILTDPETEKTVDVISRSNIIGDPTTIEYCPGVIRRVIKGREPVAVSNVDTEEKKELVDTLRVFKIESVLCVPLIRGSKVMGALYVDSMVRPYGFTKQDVSLFLDLAKRIAMAMESAQFAFDSSIIPENTRSNVSK
jgi:3',5'-cyclic-nucleotide phosphodiesterase